MIDSGTAAHDGDYREECFAMLAGVIGRMARRRGSIDDIEAALIAEAIAAAWDEAGNDADLGTVPDSTPCWRRNRRSSCGLSRGWRRLPSDGTSWTMPPRVPVSPSRR